ncbi:MAG: NAD(P)/FAD-dependent oxidoreductase [Planctomycetota bacterium]
MDDIYVPEPLRGLPHIVVLGAGFAGLTFCREFKGNARVTVVDKQNHHLFQPLLYQVAMAGLSAPDIAEPVRSIFRNRSNVVSFMGEAQAIDLQKREVNFGERSLEYDYLVCALGGVKSYFGNEHWEQHAPGLKTLDDAMRIRRRVLSSFEKAETAIDPKQQEMLMTIVVVGGGPTGVELAGSMAELARRVFRKDFRRINPAEARVILVHSKDRILQEYPEDLSQSAKEQLESLGVEIIFSDRVVDVHEDHVMLKSGQRIETRNVLWGAGVKANPITASVTEGCGIELARGGRVPVDADLSLASHGHPEVFFVGDIASIQDKDGRPIPGVAPAAIQMGNHVAKLIEARLERQIARSEGPETNEPFVYWDKGMMATIGRKRAVAWTGDLPFIRGLKMKGFMAWMAWMFVHIAYLVGFRNRLAVMSSWIYAYVMFRRGARIIVSPIGSAAPGSAPAPTAPPPSSDASA